MSSPTRIAAIAALFVLISASPAAAQVPVAGDYRSAASGGWDIPGNWERYNGTTWVSAPASPMLTDGVITIRNGFTVSATPTMDIDQIVVESGATLIIASGKTIRIQDGAGDDLVVNGTLQTIGNIELELTSSAKFNSGSLLDNDRQFKVLNDATVVFDGTAQVDNADAFTVDNNGQATFNSGTFVMNASTFEGKSNAIVTFNDATIRNEDAVALGGSAQMIFNSGAVYDHAVNGNNFPKAGFATWNAGSTCIVTGSIDKMPGEADQSFANFTWNSPGQTVPVTLDGQFLAVNGNFRVVSTGSSYLSWLDVAGNAMLIGGNLEIAGGEFVVMDRNKPGLVDVEGDVILSGGVLNFTTDDGTPEMRINGNFTQTGGTVTETSPAIGLGRIVFDGSTPQSITAGGTISNTIEFHIDNPSGVTLASDFSPPDSLRLIDGNITTSTHKVIVGSGVTLATPGGYIDGALQKTFSGLGTKTFEVGSSNGYTPVDVQATAGSGNVIVRATGESLAGAGAPENTLNHYWSITTSTVTEANLVFTYLESDFPVGLDELGVETTYYDGVYFTFPYAPVDNVANTITANAVTPDGSWTLIKEASLPVEASPVSVVVEGHAAVVGWASRADVENTTFEIELSHNEAPYRVAATQATLYDAAPTQGYVKRLENLQPGDYRLRLKKTGTDGSFSYSAIVEFTIELDRHLTVEPAFPNPFSGSTLIRFGTDESQPVRVELFNTLGQLVDVLFDDVVPPNQMQNLQVDGTGLPAGIYFVRTVSGVHSRTARIVLYR